MPMFWTKVITHSSKVYLSLYNSLLVLSVHKQILVSEVFTNVHKSYHNSPKTTLPPKNVLWTGRRFVGIYKKLYQKVIISSKHQNIKRTHPTENESENAFNAIIRSAKK